MKIADQVQTMKQGMNFTTSKKTTAQLAGGIGGSSFLRNARLSTENSVFKFFEIT